MRGDELEHAIRATTQIIKDDQVIVIGSQSILGSYSEDQLPTEATMSPEVDIAPMRDADADALSDQLSFDVGEWSEFHTTYGFYIEGVGKRTAILPPDWEYRLVGVRSEATNNATGLCLDPHDLCAAKLMAHRTKDFAFVRALVEAHLIRAIEDLQGGCGSGHDDCGSRSPGVHARCGVPADGSAAVRPSAADIRP